MCDCGCATPTATETAGTAAEGRSFAVTGMTCQPCVTRVTAAVQQVAGVGDVTVDLATGRLTVTGNATDADINAAVIGAGYRISTT